MRKKIEFLEGNHINNNPTKTITNQKSRHLLADLLKKCDSKEALHNDLCLWEQLIPINNEIVK